MALTGALGSFHHPSISRIDYKALDMDRVLTALLARLWHQGFPQPGVPKRDLDVDAFVDLLPEERRGLRRVRSGDHDPLDRHPPAGHGQPGQGHRSGGGPRPLHGFTYRFRNSRKSRPYGADEQLYEMLTAVPGTLDELKQFFFSDTDRVTGMITPGPDTDVETQALLHLVELAGTRVQDKQDTSKPRRERPPLCTEPARQLCRDVMRLLYHQEQMPRTVLVDYLKVLFAFHLSLYHPAHDEAGAGRRRRRLRATLLPQRAPRDRLRRPLPLPGTALPRRRGNTGYASSPPGRTQRRRLVPPDPALRPGDLPGQEARRIR